MFYSVGIFKTASPEDSITSNPERTVLRRQGEEPDYTEVLQQRTGNLNIKRLLLIKKKQISQVKESCPFLCTVRCKNLGLLKLFLPYASQLSGTSILRFDFSHYTVPPSWQIVVTAPRCS